MTIATRQIEIDEATAAALEARAAEAGLSVSELVALLIQGEPFSMPPEQLAELDRRCGAIESEEPTILHEDVVRWLGAWGTPAFRPWRA